MHQGNQPRTRVIGALLLAAVVCRMSVAAEPVTNVTAGSILEPAVWQGPELSVSPSAGNSPATKDSAHSVMNPLRVALQPTPPVPPQNYHVSPFSPGMQGFQPQTHAAPTNPTATAPTQPLLDGNSPVEELMPPVVEGCDENGARQGVQPYGGGHPTDWSWGCGGSPYRTGPGLCDNWKVGPRWHITIEGIVMLRDETDLTALVAQMRANNTFMSSDGTAVGGGTDMPPESENFHYGPGGRITFTSQVGRCAGYDIQAVYEGVNDWNANVVFPKEALEPVFFSPIHTTTSTTTTATTVVGVAPNTTTTTTTTTSGSTTFSPGPLPLQPPAPFPDGFQQRSLQYRSELNSGELNFLTNYDPDWRPFFGVRFIRFDDEINDFLNQELQSPLPFAGVSTTAGQFLAVAETDRVNLFHVQNNLMGFQVGLLHDTLHVNSRLSIEGFVNTGVYYNKVKYSNVMVVQTTQVVADDTSTTTTSEARTDNSTIVNNDARDLSEISYVSEASLTGVCRLNKCWALRGGYQILWIDNLHLADAAYLGNPEQSDSLFFQGWHAGIECRR